MGGSIWIRLLQTYEKRPSSQGARTHGAPWNNEIFVAKQNGKSNTAQLSMQLLAENNYQPEKSTNYIGSKK